MINLETTSLIIFGFEIVDIFGFSFFFGRRCLRCPLLVALLVAMELFNFGVVDYHGFFVQLDLKMLLIYIVHLLIILT